MLPIVPIGNQYKLIDANEARKRGFLHLARWLEKAQEEWTSRRSAKADRMSVYERLNRFRGLTTQNPQAEYRVIYNTSGTYLTSSVVETRPIEFEINGQYLTAHGFLADYKTYYYETSNSNEAFFLAAILNAPMIDKLIKPMQSRGLWGPRDICKKVLELPIPKFDSKNSTHQRLAELSKDCSIKVDQWLKSGSAGNIRSIGKLRGMVRKMLKNELQEIDELVK